MELTGTWENQLGSIVTLITNNDGTLVGEYHTKVSSADKELPETKLFGSFQKTESGLTFGFVVQWRFEMPDGTTKYSTTSWSGFGRDNNPDKFETSWILTSFLPSNEEWKSRNIGADVFIRKS